MLSLLVLAALVLAVWHFVGRSQRAEATVYAQEGTVKVKGGLSTISL